MKTMESMETVMTYKGVKAEVVSDHTQIQTVHHEIVLKVVAVMNLNHLMVIMALKLAYCNILFKLSAKFVVIGVQNHKMENWN